MVPEIEVQQMPYASFVAFIGQENSPPGSEHTLRAWIEHGGIDLRSHVLDLACSTGWNSRWIAELVGCTGAGIDVSTAAIERAQSELRRTSKSAALKYVVADAAALPFGDEEFTHVLAGCTLSFIQNRAGALRECGRVLGQHGALCVANFYYYRRPTLALLDNVERVVGFRPRASWNARFWESLISQVFTLEWEAHSDLPVYPDSEVAAVAREAILNSDVMREYAPQVREACFHRLLDTRLVLNRHRSVQRVAVQVWRKRSK